MKRSLAWSAAPGLAACLLAACAATPIASAQQLSAIAGEWRGVGLQVDREGVQSTWTMSLSVARDGESLIDYPTLSCGGSWTLQQAAVDQFEFIETIDHGPCVTGGRIHVTFRANRLFWFWYGAPGFVGEASAVLYRAEEVAHGPPSS
jgi:hypothetical protein